MVPFGVPKSLIVRGQFAWEIALLRGWLAQYSRSNARGLLQRTIENLFFIVTIRAVIRWPMYLQSTPQKRKMSSYAPKRKFFFYFKILCMNKCGTSGFLCKICDRFFCSSEEAHLRHCSSLEHYDRVCRRVAPPRFEPPRGDRFRHEGFRREFIMASLDNLDRLTATEIQDNLTRR